MLLTMLPASVHGHAKAFPETPDQRQKRRSQLVFWESLKHVSIMEEFHTETCAFAQKPNVQVSRNRAHFCVHSTKIGTLWSFTNYWPFADCDVQPHWLSWLMRSAGSVSHGFPSKGSGFPSEGWVFCPEFFFSRPGWTTDLLGGRGGNLRMHSRCSEKCDFFQCRSWTGSMLS